MRFSGLSIATKGAALAAAAFVSTSASAAVQFTLPLAGSSSVTADGAARTYALNDGLGNTLNVKVTAWTAQGTTPTSKIYNSRIGRYTNGLGVLGDTEGSGSSNTHTIDNQSGIDFLIFQFDKNVEWVSGTFTPYKLGSNTYADADYSLAASLANYATTPNLNNMNFSNLTTLFTGSGIQTYGNTGSTGTSAINRNLNQLNRHGNIWLIGAAFNGSKDSKLDAFKFQQLVVKVPVPEPATWLMMIAGFGLIGGSIRRQRKNQAALSVA